MSVKCLAQGDNTTSYIVVLIIWSCHQETIKKLMTLLSYLYSTHDGINGVIIKKSLFITHQMLLIFMIFSFNKENVQLFWA
jgi:hypothetical protein